MSKNKLKKREVKSVNDLKKVLSSASSLSRTISELLKKSTYENYDDNDEEQLLLLDEFKRILDKLENAKRDIDYLNRPIAYAGFLQKNSRGRYEIGDKEFTSGNGIEVLVYDNFYEKKRWTKARIEHDGEDYYLIGYKDVPMQGLKVRIRD